jgi:hypothetical protein
MTYVMKRSASAPVAASVMVCVLQVKGGRSGGCSGGMGGVTTSTGGVTGGTTTGTPGVRGGALIVVGDAEAPYETPSSSATDLMTCV